MRFALCGKNIAFSKGAYVIPMWLKTFPVQRQTRHWNHGLLITVIIRAGIYMHGNVPKHANLPKISENMQF
jgi:hypothetical protein